MPQGDILGFAPPLIVNNNDIDSIVGRAENAVNKVMDKLITSGQWNPK
jgi:L-2,4-diaminobutyrate transaminase